MLEVERPVQFNFATGTLEHRDTRAVALQQIIVIDDVHILPSLIECEQELLCVVAQVAAIGAEQIKAVRHYVVIQ